MEKVNELTNVRKLATIARIEEIKEIPDAANIQHARIRGWWVVVKRGEFVPGDLCIYVEVDSVMPDGLDPEKAEEWRALNKDLSRTSGDDAKLAIKTKMEEISKLNLIPEFEFLRSSKFRIKTKRIFGEISQGICFPISILEEFYKRVSMTDDGRSILDDIALDEGTDVTAILRITQFIPPDPAIMGGDAKGDMQNLGLMISDEERIENLNSKYETMRKFRYVKTEKLEGTSFTACLKNGVFSVTGRTIEYKTPEPGTPTNQMNVYWKVAVQEDIENKLRKAVAERDPGLESNIALQGEIVGEGIQSNIYKLKGQTVRFYNAFLIDSQEYMEYERFVSFIKEIGLETVPVIDMDYELPEDPMDLLKDADAATTVFGNNPKQLIEGYVYTAKGKIPQGTRVTRANFGRLSFKAKSRTYDMNK